ncbi:MAG TPA: NAD(P)-dependent alcohol dehydrogenase [Thermoleophilia bacterium]|nr:NAD(P)-dependent alcohol dehydrogenase [Thermoleophilia bacterium]
MKAIVCTAYGDPDVLKLEEVEKPRPKQGEVLVRVHATTASRADCEIRRFEFPAWIWLPIRLAFGVVRPRVRILGQEFAGEVAALGDGTTSYAPGDRVYGTTGIGLGAYAEYVCAGGRRAGSIVSPMPATLSYAEAAAVPYGAMEAHRFLGKAGVGAGQRVLIIGAGGSFGTYAVQLANHAGAEVVAVDSAGKLEMLREIGAAQVIDYTAQDWDDGAGDFDIVFDVIGRAPFGRVVRLLRPGGRYVVGMPHTAQVIRGLWASLTGGKKMVFSSGTATGEHLRAVTELIEAGALRPVIDRQYPLEQMAEAHRYAETEQKLGNIVIVVGTET